MQTNTNKYGLGGKMKPVIIATRKSPLAMQQAEFVKNLLEKYHPHLQVELKGFSTEGDRFLSSPLAKIGGKGLFVKELERAMIEGEADLAVHSLKDMPAVTPDELVLHTICKRHSPFDAFVSNRFNSLQELPPQAIVGTSSLRRQAQLLALRPDLKVISVRGSVNTRLGKVDSGECDALILAEAGLKRLGFDERIRHIIQPPDFIPAVGQGALGLECRKHDEVLYQLLEPLADEETTICVRAERAMNAHLRGGCQVPIGGFAVIKDGVIDLQGLVGQPDGSVILRSHKQGSIEYPERLGEQVAEELLSQGAREIIDAVYKKTD